MALLFAAVLGNAVAWCVHALTWWLREKCLWLIGACGFCMTWFAVFGIAMSFALAYGMGMRDLSNTEVVVAQAQADREANHFLLNAFAVMFALALIGCWHGWLLKHKGKTRYVFAIGAMYAEMIAPLFLVHFVLRRAAPRLGDPGTWSFYISLIILALFRPLVVRYTSRFWKLLRPEKTETI